MVLHWTDPFGTAANDYDLYVLSGDLATIVRFSNNTQNGSGGDDDPVEIVSFFGSGASLGERLVVVRAAGAGRLLNLVGFRGELEQATASALRGHAAAAGALAIAAAPAADGYATGQPSRTLSARFRRQPAERDVQRRRAAADLLLRPGRPPARRAAGRFLRHRGSRAREARAHGRRRRRRPRSTASRVSSAPPPRLRTPRRSRRSTGARSRDSTPTPCARALLAEALDIEVPGPDPTTGRGLVDLGAMLTAAAVPLRANLELGGVVPVELAGNGDAVLDPGERFRLDVELANVGGAAALAVSAVLAATDPRLAVLDAVGGWADLAPGSSGCDWRVRRVRRWLRDRDRRRPRLAGRSCPSRSRLSTTAGSRPRRCPSRSPWGPREKRSGSPTPAHRSSSRTRPCAGRSRRAGARDPRRWTASGAALSDLDFAFDGDLCTIAIGATTVGLEHPFVSNLLIELVAPSGAVAPLIRYADGFGNHFCQTRLDDESAGPSIQSVSTGDNPFTGSYLPAWPLALFDGEDANGVWTLRVTDWNPLRRRKYPRLFADRDAGDLPRLRRRRGDSGGASGRARSARDPARGGRPGRACAPPAGARPAPRARGRGRVGRVGRARMPEAPGPAASPELAGRRRDLWLWLVPVVLALVLFTLAGGSAAWAPPRLGAGAGASPAAARRRPRRRAPSPVRRRLARPRSDGRLSRIRASRHRPGRLAGGRGAGRSGAPAAFHRGPARPAAARAAESFAPRRMGGDRRALGARRRRDLPAVAGSAGARRDALRARLAGDSAHLRARHPALDATGVGARLPALPGVVGFRPRRSGARRDWSSSWRSAPAGRSPGSSWEGSRCSPARRRATVSPPPGTSVGSTKRTACGAPARRSPGAAPAAPESWASPSRCAPSAPRSCRSPGFSSSSRSPTRAGRAGGRRPAPP